MKKIGIMGGTFNPIHYGHLLLAESAYEQFALDAIWVMPNSQPAYRMISSNVSAKDRTAMVRLAIADNPHLTLSMAELDRAGTTYTVDTLRLLRQTYSDLDFYFIMGADSLFHFESWKEPEKIVRLCHILAAQRTAQVTSDIESQIDYLMSKYDADIHLLKTPNLDISSHAIRKRVRNGSSIKYLLPDCVAQYIREHGLYNVASEGCL